MWRLARLNARLSYLTRFVGLEDSSLIYYRIECGDSIACITTNKACGGYDKN
jgi:hypothetical protein